MPDQPACTHSRKITVGTTISDHLIARAEWCPECGALRHTYPGTDRDPSLWHIPVNRVPQNKVDLTSVTEEHSSHGDVQ